MKNWKTTLIGCLLAATIAAQTIVTDGFTGTKEQIGKLVIAVLIAAFGVLAKDFDISGK